MADKYTQEDRKFSITAPGGEDDLLLLREMAVQESISGMYRIQLSCLSERPDIKFADMIGGELGVRMKLPKEGSCEERFFHGIVSRFSQGPPVGRFISYQCEVVPWIWLLTRGSDCRIFQHETVPDILEKVFEKLGMSDYELKLNRTYSKREYCVQYRETHFNFVSRLMEEAGISYYFEHSEKAHTLILFDDPAGNPSVPYDSQASYASAEDEDRASGEIEEWHSEQVLPSGACAATDFNFEDPSMDLFADAPSSISMGSNERFEIYDYPGEYTALGDGEAKAKLRMEAEESASYSIRGQSSRGDFGSGCTFDLIGHYRDDFNATYLLTEVVHHATQSYESDGGESSYSNSFHCIPHEVPYRTPQLTEKPNIGGAQTATVVGASGEEIDVDEYGRIVVQFHWDRLGEKDENSSCRVRVSQSWAGKGWGAIFHPRIGQEVIVEFLEGDPDRPIVTGRVYNGEQTVPYTLPADKTKSGIKSRSTKEGQQDNFNEIRFDDKKGSELVSIQAEKDLERLVKNDETDKVQNNRTRDVGANEVIRIGENLTVDVGKDKAVTVAENHSETIGSDQSLSVGGDRTRSVDGSETVDVGSDQSITIGGSLSQDVGDEMSVNVGSKLTLEAADQITLKTGSAKIIMKKNGDITIQGKKINIKGSGDVKIKGSKVAAN